MYRQHENSCKLEEEFKKLKEEYQNAVNEGADEDILISLHDNIEDMRERLNFAYQDEAY